MRDTRGRGRLPIVILVAAPLTVSIVIACGTSADGQSAFDESDGSVSPDHVWQPWDDGDADSFVDAGAACDAAEPTEPNLIGGRLRADMLGPPCGFEYVCPEEMGCAHFLYRDPDAGERPALWCIRGRPCDFLACTACEVCGHYDNNPATHFCGPRME